MEGSQLSSDAQGKGVLVDVVYTDVDRISELTIHLLLKILSTLSTKEAVRTSVLSKRWVNVWKETPHLFLDMTKIAKFTTPLVDVIHHTRSMTKVINDHSGHLERCTIYYFTYQCENGMVESWIRSLVHVRHVKHLTLVNCLCFFIPRNNFSTTLDLPPGSFSDSNLKSLYLGRYTFNSPHAFNNCWNLKNLKLVSVFAEIGVFNAVLFSCPSLEVLILNITCPERSGTLKIDNRNLKFLYLSCYHIDGVEVSTPNLEVFIVKKLSCKMENLIISDLRLQFNRNYWSTGQAYQHTSYNISSPHQGQKSIGHEFLISESSEYMISLAPMSVSVNLTNTKEVEMLKEVLVAWPDEMQELEILFKNSNAPREDGESSKTQKKFWEETKPFPNAYFRAYIVWLFNFSGSEEEFALASRLITQGTVVKSMIIKPSSGSVRDNLKIEAAVDKLKGLPKGHKGLCIKMF